MTLNTLSRLKGIETLEAAMPTVALSPLNTLSRLKGIETFPHQSNTVTRDPLNTLSRLKGIETFVNGDRVLRFPHFEYTFPFEGN